MRLLKPYTPRYNFCVVCGDKCEDETCSDRCKGILVFLRQSIKDRIKEEKKGAKNYDEKTIRQFNKVQDAIR